MASLLAYDENEMEQLGQKLLCTTLELEKLKAEAMDVMMENKEYINNLIRLLDLALKERDEARTQFQNLLNRTTTTTPLFQPNSSITESNSLSDPYNNYGSSPVNSLFDVSSPEFSNFTQPFVDQEQLIIDTLAKGKVLPQYGNFLQAVIQAGPLLQPLMVAGPLPRWRNPPQPLPFQIPPVAIKPCESDPFSYKQEAFSPLSAQIQSAPMMNFGNCGSNSSLMNGNGYSSSLGKRQRFN